MLPCQRHRSVLLPRTYAPLHGDARKRAIPARLVLPYRSHILARRRSSTGDRRRLASSLGSAGFYMLWQRLFSSQDSDRGNHDLMLGTAYGAVLYFSLYLIPQAVTAFLIPLVFLPLFGLTSC